MVVHDSGRARSVKPYFDAYGIKLPDPSLFSRRGRLPAVNAVKQLREIESVYPVKSIRMSPGIVPERRVSYTFLESPFCIVGDEDASMKWLSKNYISLVKLGVGCFIADIQSRPQYEKIKKRFPNLKFWPANVDELSEQYQVYHYPVLISREFIEQ